MNATRWKNLGMLVLGLAAAGCGDSNDPDNDAPTANFAFECTDLDCTFTNLSSDSDGTVAESDWDFGDDALSGNNNPTHTYALAGDFQVSLTVTDNGGETGTVTKTVNVTEPAPGAPVAASPSPASRSTAPSKTTARTPTAAPSIMGLGIRRR